MEAVARLHAAPGGVLIVALGAFTVGAAALAVSGRAAPQALDAARGVVLAVVVAVAAIGLVLVLRGAAPREWIHWLYGPLLLLALTLPSALRLETERARSGALAVAAAIATLLAWRLWSSG